MVLRKSYEYDRFVCLAEGCPDSCCHEWEVLVDRQAADRYRNLEGPLGERLRQVLREDAGEVYMTLEGDRCPMWRGDGLCRIQAELGHEALCRTCREFPRLKHDYGDFVELGLELSCPEAARLLLEEAEGPEWVEEHPGTGEADYDREAMEVLLETRREALALTRDPSLSQGEVLACLLLYGCEVQARLDGDPGAPFCPAAALESARDLARNGSMEEVREFFLGLDLLTERWENRLKNPLPRGNANIRRLLRYFIRRHWLQAVSDYDLYCRVKFIIIACLLVKHLGGDIFRTAQLFSKEIENSIDNVEALLDAAYAHPAFTDDKILGFLLK